MSAFVGYVMPKPSLSKNSCVSIQSIAGVDYNIYIYIYIEREREREKEGERKKD